MAAGIADRMASSPWENLQSFPLPLFNLDAEGRVLCCNAAFPALFDLPETDSGDIFLRDIFYNAPPFPQSASDDAGAGGVAYLVGCGTEQQNFLLYLFPPEWTDGIGETRIGALLTLSQLSQLDGAHRLPNEKPELFRSLFENTALGMATADEAGNLQQINPSFRRFLGCGILRKPRLNLLEIVHPDRRCDVRLWFRSSGNAAHAVYNSELPFLRPDGDTVWGHVTITRLPSGRSGSGRFVALIQDVTERKRAEEEVRRLAYYDVLTGLANRTLLKNRMTLALSQLERSGGSLGVLFLDLDRFKRINDTLGHAAGDLLLESVAERLQRCVRRGDTVARLGGDEFVILLAGLPDEKGITAVARKILESLAPPFQLEGQEIHATTSIGIAVAPENGSDVDTLLRHADLAMYAAKEKGRNNYQFFSAEMNLKAKERLELETGLRRALQNDEFSLHYHPQLDLDSGRVTGIEALLRWHRPDGQTFLPGDFLPLAEESGLILQIGEWVLNTACLQAKEWQDRGYPHLRMVVNISGCQFKRPDFVCLVEKALRGAGLAPFWLELDLTESILMENVEETVTTLRRLKEIGVHLAIDDFGTGYSSLSFLKNFPIDRLKIAQAFVQGIADPDRAVIVDAIAAVAGSLGIKLMAEGVETREQIRYLRQRHCHEMQGFYFSPPMPGHAFTRYLETGLAEEGLCLFGGASG
jgi:diguanylate cyclase (GGDEF)-like protein/PAS domain S-box-containing protein